MLLIIYLLLTAVALWALGQVLKQMQVERPTSTIVLVIAGIVLVVLAFAMAGIPVFA